MNSGALIMAKVLDYNGLSHLAGVLNGMFKGSALWGRIIGSSDASNAAAVAGRYNFTANALHPHEITKITIRYDSGYNAAPGFSFASNPQIMLTLGSLSESLDIAHIQVAVADVGSSSFSVNVFHDGDANRSPIIYWIAFASR